MRELYGLVLSGGQSRRMGEDKAYLQLGGASLMDIAWEILSRAGCSEIRISSNRQAGAIKDIFQNYGPVAGIHAGVNAYLEDDIQGYLLVIPIDMPMLSQELLEKLITQADSAQLVRFSGNQLPFLLKLDSQCLIKLTTLLARTNESPGVSLKKMFSVFNEHIIEPDSDRLGEFVNCNSQADFEKLKSKFN